LERKAERSAVQARRIRRVRRILCSEKPNDPRCEPAGFKRTSRRDTVVEQYPIHGERDGVCIRRSTACLAYWAMSGSMTVRSIGLVR
jgi:hypothetical protein